MPPTSRLGAATLAVLDLRLPRALRRIVDHRRAPTAALVLILAFSVAARLIDINQPCASPCRTPASHTLIFDEAFYVNAARAIAAVPQPPKSPYAGSPKDKDPNAEHPQLAKVIMAGGIDLFGDNPWGWRLGSVLFSVIAMVALYYLVRGVGGGEWLAVGAVGVMALDNLALVHGRIATLDVYAMAMMLVAGALYVRRRPVLAGVALGVGACMKVVALYLLVSFVLYELMLGLQTLRSTRAGRRPPSEAQPPGGAVALPGRGSLAGAVPLVWCVAATAVAFFGLLWMLDLLVPAWDPGSRKTYGGNPFAHFSHMVKFAELLKENPKHPGISSTPLQWLIDRRSIPYAKTQVTVTHAVNGIHRIQRVTTTIFFQGKITPFIIFSALPGLVLATWFALRLRDRVALLGVCWAIGTYAPFFVQSEILHRTTYLFYMLIVMPGIYIFMSRVLSPRYVPRLVTLVWVGLVTWGFIEEYPFRTLLG